MKTLLTIILALALTSCGKDDTTTVSAGVNPDGTPTTTVKGDKGDKGDKGEKGDSGTSQAPVPSNQFYDAINGQYWLMTNIATSTTGFTDATSACTGDYRIPSKTEIQTALVHGMGTAALALASPPTYIMPSVASIPGTGWVVKISDATLVSNGNAAQFCIKK